MLPPSRCPQILRLHSLQSGQRHRFMSSYFNCLNQIFPSILSSPIFTHPLIKTLLPDIYFTWITICKCKKRLGQEYTYVTMFKEKHYQEEGVLVNSKVRVLVFVMEIIARNWMNHFLNHLQSKITNKINNYHFNALCKSIGTTKDILENIQWFLLMLFMLNIVKSPNFIDISLGINYIYTFFNENQTKISYKYEGLLLLVVFIIKFVNFFINLRKQIILQQKIQKVEQEKQQKQQKPKLSTKQSKQSRQICRICYCQIEQKSCTKCGHTFCWQCIIKSLQINSQCPVCRTKCLPRHVIQLINY